MAGPRAMIQSFARTRRYRVDGRTLRRKYSAKQVAKFTSCLRRGTPFARRGLDLSKDLSSGLRLRALGLDSQSTGSRKKRNITGEQTPSFVQ